MAARRREGCHIYPYTENERRANGQRRYAFYLSDGAEMLIYRPTYRAAAAAFRIALARMKREAARAERESMETLARIEEYARKMNTRNRKRPTYRQATFDF